VLVIEMTAQSAHAMEVIIHNHEIPAYGRTLKYEFFNTDVHFVYFATRTVYPGGGNIIINIPDEQFHPGDTVKGCAVGLGPNPFTLCADPIQAGNMGLEFDFDIF
jgi:hypothetical protein